MESHCISFAQIPHTASLFRDYLYRFSQVARFYRYDPFAPGSFSAAAQTIEIDIARCRAVAEVLAVQNESFGAGRETQENINRLREGQAVAVVTGQQVGLFGGPTYSVYKALTAVRLAERLTAEGIAAVPVFWLASDDHDFGEVDHCVLLDNQYQLLTLRDSSSPPPNMPVGQIVFDGSVTDLRRQVVRLWPPEAANEAQNLLAAYVPGASYAQAFGTLLHRLFAGRGLVVLEPSHPTLHALCRPLFRRALEEADDLHALLRSRSRELSQAGYHLQVRPRENATLLFLLMNGRRLPLRRGRKDFVLPGKQESSLANLLQQLDDVPECFSPNVLLRPLMQDMLLPTVAYVAGPNEVTYFAQASVLYEKLLGRQPVIVPRVSMTLVDPKVRRLLTKYRLTLTDLFDGRVQVRAKLAERHLPPRLLRRLEAAEGKILNLVAEVAREVKRLDPTLEGAAETSRRKMLYQFGKIRSKAAQAQAERKEIIARHLDLLFNTLYPARGLQERRVNFLSFVARHGQQLVPRLLEHVDWPCRDHQVIFL